MADKCYIKYYNKEKNFSIDKKDFDTYDDAFRWAMSNFEKFDQDMISYY